MNISDLQVGNLVFYVSSPNGLTETKERVVVLGCNSIEELVYIWGDGYRKWVNLSSIEQIPLDNDELDRLGFLYGDIDESWFCPIRIPFPSISNYLESGYGFYADGCFYEVGSVDVLQSTLRRFGSDSYANNISQNGSII